MMFSGSSTRPKLRFLPSRSAVLVALVAVGVVLGSAEPTLACGPIISQAGNQAKNSVKNEIAALKAEFVAGFTKVEQALVKLANQTTNNVQNKTNAESVMNDSRATRTHADSVGQVRSEIAGQMVPSRVACRLATAQKAVGASYKDYDKAKSKTQTDATNFLMNAPGTPGEKGALAAMNWGFNHRCEKYADKDALALPAAACPGAADPEFIDLDIQPQKSLFGAITYKDADHQEAATDTIRLLTQVAADDPVRGPVLSRTDGQNIHVLKMRDLTRMNLASGILQDVQAMRAIPAEAGADGRKVSRLARYMELLTGPQPEDSGKVAFNMLDAVKGAGEPNNANVASLAARLAAQRMMLTEVLRMTEQMVAVASVNLAVQVEGSRVGGTGVSSRVMQSN